MWTNIKVCSSVKNKKKIKYLCFKERKRPKNIEEHASLEQNVSEPGGHI
jgi:hypothetical protein